MKLRLLYAISMAVAMMGCSSDEPEVGDPKDVTVTMTNAGQLSEALGARANEITKLTVRGPINSDDFNAMWSASFNGQLSVIDLSGAAIDGNAIPANAFYHPDVQGDIQIYPHTVLADIKLAQIILPEGIFRIGAYAFAGIWRLKEINLPSTIEILEPYAFTGCGGLTSVSFPDQIKSIGEFCFYDCRYLTELYLPSTLESLGKESLNVKLQLSKIYSAAKNPPVCHNTASGYTPFGDYTKLSNSCIIDVIPVYVPAGSAELYRNAPGWDYFKNFIELDPFPTEAATKD